MTTNFSYSKTTAMEQGNLAQLNKLRGYGKLSSKLTNFTAIGNFFMVVNFFGHPPPQVYELAMLA
jgi:hypothetical protein